MSLEDLVPIVVGLIAIPLLDEPLTGWLMCGLVLVSLGAYLASKRDKPQALPLPKTEI